MPFIGIRELARETSKILKSVEDDGEPVIITRQGRPIAALTRVDPEQVEELVLSIAPEHVNARTEAEEAVRAGEAVVFEDEPTDVIQHTVIPAAETWLEPSWAEYFEREQAPAISLVAQAQVAEAVDGVVRALAPVEGAAAGDEAKRVGTLNAYLFKLLYEYARARNEQQSIPGLEHLAVTEAGRRLRSINARVLANSQDAGLVSFAAYNAAASSIVNFEDVAHAPLLGDIAG
jgi:prevent-host-death family protein